MIPSTIKFKCVKDDLNLNFPVLLDRPDNHVQAPRLQPTHQTTQKKATPLQGVVLGPGRRPDKDKNAAAKKTQKPKIRNYNIKDDKGMT